MPRPRLPRLTIRRLMAVTALVAFVLRLTLRRPSADEFEFLEIIIGAAGMTIVLVSFYFALWFAALAFVWIYRRLATSRN